MISFDQLGNSVLGGDPDETISSRCGKVIKTCILCRFFCWIANKIDNNHCQNSIEYDEGRSIDK